MLLTSETLLDIKREVEVMADDIVQRLRDRAYSGLPDPLSEEAANEIERLLALADKRGEIAVNRRREIERLQSLTRFQDGVIRSGDVACLTTAEREAIHHVVGDVADITGPVEDTLRGLLERLGHQERQ